MQDGRIRLLVDPEGLAAGECNYSADQLRHALDGGVSADDPLELECAQFADARHLVEKAMALQ